jgi:hypothetical protein
VEVGAELEVDVCELNELDFLLNDSTRVAVCVLVVFGVACVCFDEVLVSRPPLPNSHEPWITPTLSSAK